MDPETPDTGAAVTAARENGRPPRDDLVRAVRAGVELRAVPDSAEEEASGTANGMPTLFGHFAVFNRWTEIDSFWEGHFLERIVPGAFKKTFRELGARTKVLFQHGMDFQVGDKPLGPPDVMREDDEGAYYEVPLLDTSYNRDLVPGLEAGLYGASFRFSVMREEWVEEPGVSEYNPSGLPERTLKELRVPEFGPVTFPAYEEATAGVRSLTDEFIVARATKNPDQLRAILDYLEKRDGERERIVLGRRAADPAATPATDDDAATSDDDASKANDPSSTEPAEPADEAAPSPDRAEAEPHPGSERRDQPTGLYGLPPKEQSWRL